MKNKIFSLISAIFNTIRPAGLFYFKLKRFIINYFYGIELPRLGFIRVNLNYKNTVEKRGIYENDFDYAEIQALKNILDENSHVIFYYPDSSLIPLFIGRNIGCPITIIGSSDRIKKNIQKNKIEKITFSDSFEKLKPSHFCYCLLIVKMGDINKLNFFEQVDGVLVIMDDYENNFVFNQFFSNSYKWLNGRALELNNPLSSVYYLFTNNKYTVFNIHTKSNDQKISGFSLIRNADIYPFDLCYESVLPIVDEFILGIDKNVPTNDGKGEYSRKYFIQKFLETTTYPDKIKIIDCFDFKVRFCKNMLPRARWIVDVNNFLLDNCSYANCLYIMADEMYHEDSFEEILNFAMQDKYDSMWHYFLHFVSDLSHIRNPETVDVTHAVRVFKKDNYASFHDGYSFASISNEFPSHTIKKRPLGVINAKYPIYHLGYVMDFRKKIRKHSERDGIFSNKDFELLLKEEIADLIEFQGIYPKFLFNERSLSYHKVKHLLPKNK